MVADSDIKSIIENVRKKTREEAKRRKDKLRPEILDDLIRHVEYLAKVEKPLFCKIDGEQCLNYNIKGWQIKAEENDLCLWIEIFQDMGFEVTDKNYLKLVSPETDTVKRLKAKYDAVESCYVAQVISDCERVIQKISEGNFITLSSNGFIKVYFETKSIASLYLKMIQEYMEPLGFIVNFDKDSQNWWLIEV